MTIAERLADWLSTTETVPEEAALGAVKCIFDLTTAAVAGYRTPNAAAVRRIAPAIWGAGPAAIWFSGDRATPAGAAFANAACACSLDLDDGHRTAAGHPGAGVIPAVFAALDGAAADPSRLLTAVALGYEIGVRVSASRDLKTIPTVNSGLWTGQAVAAAVGWLRRLPPLQIAHAIAIAGTTAPSQSATSYTRYRGNSVKEGIPWGAANGLLAVELAAAGFTGPLDIFDEPQRYAAAQLLDGLGSRWQIDGTYFKPYSACRWIHAPLDGLLTLQAEHGIAADDILAIEVDTFQRAYALSNEVAPKTFEGAQYSIPFCLGVAAVHGASALLPLDEAALADAAAIAVADRVRMTVTPEFDAMFPAAVPGRVRVRTAAGLHERAVLLPKGEPANPMTWKDIDAKFGAVAGARLAAPVVARIRGAVGALRDGDPAPLRGVLAGTIFS